MTNTLPTLSKKETLNPDRLMMQPGQRGTIVGTTGSGKSFLAKLILRHWKGNLIVVDPKRMFVENQKDMDDLRISYIAETVPEIRLHWFLKHRRIVYRPKAEQLADLTAYNELFKFAYDKGEVLVYTDDMLGVLPPNTNLRWLQICYQMGRAKKVTMLSTIQRPAWFPLFLMSESNHWYVFRLRQPVDIKRVQAFVPGYDPDVLRTIQQQGYETGNEGMEHPFAYADDVTDVKYTYINGGQ